MMRLDVECDGGSRGNPGIAGCGSSVLDGDQEVAARWEFIAKATNNVAEYQGLINALELAIEVAKMRGAAPSELEIQVRMDSKLVVEQMSGRWKIKHPDMKPLAARVKELEAILAKPSLYDEALKLLARRGFFIGADGQRTDWRGTRSESPEVAAAWTSVYRDPQRHWELYELAEKLVDFEDYFRRWRFNHVTTVERIIGFKTGTGGTSGVNYLRKMLEIVLFPELWKLRTGL